MKRIFPWLLLLAAWLILGSLFIKKSICKVATSAPTKAAIIPPPVKATSRLLIEDGNQFKTTAIEHFDFKQSNLNYMTPLSAEVNTSIQKTSTYLMAHPDRSLMIIGLYKGDEENKSVFENLGIARANEVKKVLSGLGVGGKQLLTSGQLLGADKSLKDGVLLSGVNFNFTETSEDLAARLAAIKAKFEINPVTLYFSTGDDNVNLTAQQRKDFADLVFYLDNTEGSSLEVGGHTDDRGDISLNARLSRKRAEGVQKYLIQNGLEANRLSAQGYGPNKPVASNEAKQGRTKNRRVEVRLK